MEIKLIFLEKNTANGENGRSLMVNKSATDRTLTLIAAAVAGIVSVAMGSGGFTFWDTIVGLVLLNVVIVSGLPPANSWLIQLLFSCIAAFCMILIIGFALDWAFHELDWDMKIITPPNNKVRGLAVLVIWVVLTVIIFGWLRLRRI